jgi:putative metallohydrolase (TIGR04338 family)
VNTRQVDTQQNALYAAESLVWWGRRFHTDAEAQEYVDGVLASPFWQRRNRHYWGVRVSVALTPDANRGHIRISGTSIVMALPNHALNERYVLHELAHVLTHRLGEPHGSQFARVYMLLVAARLGREHARTMQRCYLAHGVKWKVCSSPEQA